MITDNMAGYVKIKGAKNIISQNMLIVITAAMFIFCAAINPNFVDSFTQSSLMQECAYMTLLAMGMTFVILTGGIDLSIGSQLGMSTTIVAIVLRDSQLTSMPLVIISAIAASLLLCLGIGFANGLGVAFLKLPPIVTTLAMTWIAKGIAEVASTGPPIRIATTEFKAFFNYKIGGWVPVTFIFVVVLLIFLSYMLKNRRSGREFYAVGSNQYAAFISGTNTKKVLIKAYLINALFAGIAGVFVAAVTGSGTPTFGVNYELYSIAAVVMGGVLLTGGEGKIYLTFFGAVILRLLNRVVIFTGLSSVSGFIEGIIVGSILILVLFINSRKKGYAD